MSKLALYGGKPVRTKPFPGWPVFSEADAQAVARVVLSGVWGCTTGKIAGQFEETFAKFQGARYGIALTNGTTALRLALLAVGIEEGDEVIVPPYTFLATATAVVECNAVPVFVDVDPETYNLDPRLIEAAITSRTRAIIPVHFAGQACDMSRILAIAKKHKLKIVEDACHGWNGRWKDKGLGCIGDLGAISFQASKNLTAGEGGFLTTNSEELYAIVKSLHNCGRLKPRPDGTLPGRLAVHQKAAGNWYAHFLIGGNHRMTEMQAALLLSQLKRVKKQTDRRQANAFYLDQELAKIPGIRPMRRDTFATRISTHLYMFRYDEARFDGKPRQKFLAALKAEGVNASAGYPMPLYKQPLFLEKNFGPYTGWKHSRSDLDYGGVSCPACEKACAGEAVWLSQSTMLGSRRDMDDIVEAIAKVQQCAAEI